MKSLINNWEKLILYFVFSIMFVLSYHMLLSWVDFYFFFHNLYINYVEGLRVNYISKFIFYKKKEKNLNRYSYAFKRFYCNFNEKKKDKKILKNTWKKLLNKLDIYFFYFLKLRFIIRIISVIFFFFGFFILFLETQMKDKLIYIYILVFIIYFLCLQTLKMNLFLARNTDDNKFYYRNLNIYILNIMLYFFLTLYNKINEDHIFLSFLKYNLYGYLNYFEIFIIFLLFFIFLLLYYNKDYKWKNSFDNDLKLKELQAGIDKLIINNFVINVIGSKIKYFLKVFKIIQIFFIYFFIFSFQAFFKETTLMLILYNLILNLYSYILILFLVILLYILCLYFFCFFICLKYSLRNSIYYKNGPPDMDPEMIIKGLKYADKTIKKVHGMSIWYVCGTLFTGLFAYDAWYRHTYPDCEPPCDKINKSYLKPFFKQRFNIPSDEDLMEGGYDIETLEKKENDISKD